jgi:AcrR family transcriptional regulator
MARSKEKQGEPPLNRAGWAAAALEAIAQQGNLELSVESLARELGVTKGSFYWHFRSRGELVLAAVELWEERGTTQVIEALRAVMDPRERLRALFALAFERARQLTAEGSLFASADPAVARIVRRVSKRRLSYLVETYRQAGMRRAEAERWALLAYSAFVGALTISRTSSGVVEGALAKGYLEHYCSVLIPSGLPAQNAG